MGNHRDRFELGAETETASASASLGGEAAEGSQSSEPVDSSEELEALAEPRRFGRYKLIRPIGRGGMGVVYQGRDLELHRDVAIKLVRATGKDPAAAQARLRREARTMAALSHPNLVAVHDIGDLGDSVFIAMELVRGGTLRDLVGARHDWSEQLRALIAAGRGLAAAHASGVIHRDFKPDNVLLGDHQRVLVADFGLARGFEAVMEGESHGEEQESRSTLGGTPAYMSPERIAGEAGDPRVDQFAWCVTAFEVLEGRRPFDSERSERRPWTRRDLPAHVRAAIDRGMSLEREARWPSMGALLDGLETPWRRRFVRPFVAVLLFVGVLGAWQLLPQLSQHDGAAAGASSKTAFLTSGPWSPTLVTRESGNHPAHFSAISDDATTIVFASRSALWTQERSFGYRRDLTVPSGLTIEALRFGRGSSLLLTGRSGSSWLTYLIDVEDDRARLLLTLPVAHFVDASRDGRWVAASIAGGEASSIGLVLVEISKDPPEVTYQLAERDLRRCVWSPSGDTLACIVEKEGEAQVVLVDVVTWRVRTLARIPGEHSISLLRWPEANQLIVVELQSPAMRGRVSVVQHWVLAGGALRQRRVLYFSPAFEVITNVEVARGRLLYTKVNERWRTGIVPLGGELSSHQLQPVDTGSLSDGPLLGWLPSGEIALDVDLDGGSSVIRMRPEGRPVRADSPFTGLWPVAIVNGVLESRTRRPETPSCAADYYEACLVKTRSEGPRDIFQQWRPNQGAVGTEVLALPRAAGSTRTSFSRSGRVAVIEEGRVGIYDWKGQRLQEVVSPHRYQDTAWSHVSQIYVLRSLETESELAKVEEDGRVTSIFRHPTFHFLQLRISPDESRALVSYVDNAVEHWSVNLQLIAEISAM